MTMEPRPVTVTVDTHPLRPEMMKRMSRHFQCCVVWRVAAGSCDKSAQGDAGRGGHASTPAGEWESGSAQYIDFISGYKRLPWLHQKVINIVVKHGPVDQQWGDPGGRGPDGRYILGHDGKDFDVPEAFWRHYATSIGNYHWSALHDVEEQAYVKMSLSLGWKPVEQDS